MLPQSFHGAFGLHVHFAGRVSYASPLTHERKVLILGVIDRELDMSNMFTPPTVRGLAVITTPFFMVAIGKRVEQRPLCQS